MKLSVSVSVMSRSEFGVRTSCACFSDSMVLGCGERV